MDSWSVGYLLVFVALGLTGLLIALIVRDAQGSTTSTPLIVLAFLVFWPLGVWLLYKDRRDRERSTSSSA